MPTTDWNPLLRAELDKPYWRDLQDFVSRERARATIYPPPSTAPRTQARRC
jgi:uracil DNA glycosylase